MLSKNTPIKPSKKKPKGRIDKIDSQGIFDGFQQISMNLFSPDSGVDCVFSSADDSFSSTNSSRSTVTRTTAVNGHQSADDEPPLMRPVRTGRAKPTCYVCVCFSIKIPFHLHGNLIQQCLA